MITLSVLITSHAAITIHPYFFSFPDCCAEERPGEISLRRGFLRNCNYRRSWRRSSVRLIRILLTRRETNIYVFISHENFTIPNSVRKESRDYAEKIAFLEICNKWDLSVSRIFCGICSFKVDIVNVRIRRRFFTIKPSPAHFTKVSKNFRRELLQTSTTWISCVSKNWYTLSAVLHDSFMWCIKCAYTKVANRDATLL